MIDNNAMFKISYGLFVLSAKDDSDNACIINTIMQVTDIPKKVTFAVNKQNKTHDMILRTGVANISVLTTSADFEVFKRFGFQSGVTADKFADYENVERSENGLYYITENTNAFLSIKVTSAIDCGTHTLFVADVTEAKVLSEDESVTYDYYFKHIKPKPEAKKKKGFVCKICGYVYEGEELPSDFICPLCKHGVEDFEPIE